MIRISIGLNDSITKKRQKQIRKQSIKQIQMEEDNEQITGWDQNDHKTIYRKHSNKTKGKLLDQTKLKNTKSQINITRKLKPSYTLPVIKNINNCQSTDNESNAKEFKPLNQLQLPMNCIDRLVDGIEEKLMMAHKKQMMKQISKLTNHGKLMIGKIDQVSQTNEKKNLPQTQQSISFQKRIRPAKHLSTIITVSEPVSNLQHLKIQAKQYCSISPKQSSTQSKDTLDLLKRLNRKSDKSLCKKEKNKYFIVHKDKISPQKMQQELSKITIQPRNSCVQNDLPSSQRRNNVLKEKYKNIIKTIQLERKNSSNMLNSKTRKIKDSKKHHQRVNTNLQEKSQENKVEIQKRIFDKIKNQIQKMRQNTFAQCLTYMQEKQKIKLKSIKNLGKTFSEPYNVQKNKSKMTDQLIKDQLKEMMNLNDVSILDVKKEKSIKDFMKNKNSVNQSKLGERCGNGRIENGKYSSPNQSSKKTTKNSSVHHGSKCYDPAVLDEFNDECLYK